MNTLRKAAAAFSQAIAPPPDLLPSVWAQENIIVTKGPKAGSLWSPDEGYEFQIGILDGLFGPHEPGETIREGVVFKGAKAGITLIVSIGIVYWVVSRRLAAAIVAPRKPDSNERAADFATMIQARKDLKRCFSKITGRTKQAHHGAELLARSAETDRDLVDWGAAVVVGDEVDRWAEQSFDPYSMIEERQGAYTERIFVQLSTPTYPEFGVHKAFEASDKRYYFVPCPLCGFRQKLSFEENITWDKTAKTIDRAMDSARFICQKCQKTWNRRARQIANKGGEWISEVSGVRRRGFAISRLYVPTALPEEFVKAFLQGQKDDQKKREFYNQKLGLPYLSSVGDLKDGAIQRLITSDILWEEPPAGYDRVFVGIDVQGTEDPLDYYYEVRAFNKENDCALICYGKACGNKQMAEMLNRTYGGFEVMRALVDISDGHQRNPIEELVKDVACLEAARFDWQAKVSFQRVRRERAGQKKSHGISGWSVKREEALNDNMMRFFEQEGKLPTIKIARNPRGGQEREFRSHYKGLKRIKEDTPQGARYVYKKRRIEGVDYPFAGALAEIARRIAGSVRGKGAYGSVKKIKKEAKKEKAAGGRRQVVGAIKIIGGGRRRTIG